MPPPTFQDMISTLPQRYWADRGCIIQQPYPSEVGAGTFNPATFLRSLGPEPWRSPTSSRPVCPNDGRYGENPNRFQQFFQYQVLLKPAPADVLDATSSRSPRWASTRSSTTCAWSRTTGRARRSAPAGSAGRCGCDGTGDLAVHLLPAVRRTRAAVVSAELTYGLDRIGMMLQGTGPRAGPQWAPGVTWGDLWVRNEWEWSTYNFEQAPVPELSEMFKVWEAEAARSSTRLVIPATTR